MDLGQTLHAIDIIGLTWVGAGAVAGVMLSGST